MPGVDAPADIASLGVPVAVRPAVAAIVAGTDAYCGRHLDREYGDLCRRVVGRLGRKRPSPLVRGDARIWAAGVIYTVGSLNFLFDRSQTPYRRADDLAAELGVAKSTMANKAARIRTLLGLGWFDSELMRRSLLEQHPLAWLVEVNGVIVDARCLPDDVQAEARRSGLIPDRLTAP